MSQWHSKSTFAHSCNIPQGTWVCYFFLSYCISYPLIKPFSTTWSKFITCIKGQQIRLKLHFSETLAKINLEDLRWKQLSESLSTCLLCYNILIKFSRKTGNGINNKDILHNEQFNINPVHLYNASLSSFTLINLSSTF